MGVAGLCIDALPAVPVPDCKPVLSSVPFLNAPGSEVKPPFVGQLHDPPLPPHFGRWLVTLQLHSQRPLQPSSPLIASTETHPSFHHPQLFNHPILPSNIPIPNPNPNPNYYNSQIPYSIPRWMTTRPTHQIQTRQLMKNKKSKTRVMTHPPTRALTRTRALSWVAAAT